MSKKTTANYSVINQELVRYLFSGYDLYFVLGWFGAYLSAPSDSEEDLVLPMYLILDDDKIIDEQKFSKLVDQLMEIYTNLADSIFEHNKLIKPVVSFTSNAFEPDTFSPTEWQNLLKWLYGFLTGYLVLGGEVTDYVDDDKLLDEKFYPALFTLCVALVSLSVSQKEIIFGDKMSADFAELLVDIKAMWESEDGSEVDEKLFAQATRDLDFTDIVTALNDLFYVMRISDEKHLVAVNHQNSLLGKLTTRH